MTNATCIIRLNFFDNFFSDFKAMLWEVLNPEYQYYGNLGLTEVHLQRVRLCIIAFFIAVAAAALITSLNRNAYGGLVQRMNADAVWSPDKAKTLAELGFEKNPAVRMALSGGRVYRGVVLCVEEEEFNRRQEKEKRQFEADAAAQGLPKAVFKARKYRICYETDRFYIPESVSIEAEMRYERKGSGILPILLTFLLSFVALIAILRFLPDILRLLDNFTGILNGS